MIPKALKLTIFLSFAVILGTMAQNPTKAAKKADKYYQLGQYAIAIPLYKEALKEKNSASWRYKLANSYRLTNKTEEAQEAFNQLFENSKKIRTKAYLHYSEVLMSNGDYTKAKEMLGEYIALKPEDEEAKKTLSQIDEIKKLKPFYSNVVLSPFNHNSNADDHGAVFMDDGIVFVSDRKRGATLFKEQTGTTGRDFLSLYFAPRVGRLEYGSPEILPRKINALNKNTGPASVTEDGTTMVFSQNDHLENKKGELSLQLFIAKREKGKWKDVNKLNFCNSNTNYMHPAISPDGKRLFFVSNKKGEGGMDLFMSTLLANGNWSKPENLGPRVNTGSHEGFPFFDKDGKLFFCSKGHLGYGGFDIYFTEMDEFGNWSKPTNLGQPINSSQDDISFCMESNGKYGLFTSSRDGGDDDIFMFRFEENDDIILSVKLMDGASSADLSDATIKAIPTTDLADSTIMDISASSIDMSLDNDKIYEIIISKDGYMPFTQTIDPASSNNNFLELEATMIKKL